MRFRVINKENKSLCKKTIQLTFNTTAGNSYFLVTTNDDGFFALGAEERALCASDREIKISTSIRNSGPSSWTAINHGGITTLKIDVDKASILSENHGKMRDRTKIDDATFFGNSAASEPPASSDVDNFHDESQTPPQI